MTPPSYKEAAQRATQRATQSVTQLSRIDEHQQHPHQQRQKRTKQQQ